MVFRVIVSISRITSSTTTTTTIPIVISTITVTISLCIITVITPSITASCCFVASIYSPPPISSCISHSFPFPSISSCCSYLLSSSYFLVFLSLYPSSPFSFLVLLLCTLLLFPRVSLLILLLFYLFPRDAPIYSPPISLCFSPYSLPLLSISSCCSYILSSYSLVVLSVAINIVCTTIATTTTITLIFIFPTFSFSLLFFLSLKLSFCVCHYISVSFHVRLSKVCLSMYLFL